jgi:hypothetical protein
MRADGHLSMTIDRVSAPESERLKDHQPSHDYRQIGGTEDHAASSRVKAYYTLNGFHSRPRGVGTPAAFKAAAIC